MKLTLGEYSNIDFKVSDFFSINKITSKTKKKFKIITALAVFYDLNDPNKFLKDVDDLSLSSGKSININLIKKVLINNE